MNKQGQIAGVGGFIMLAIALIVGAILLQGSAQNVGSSVNTVDVANQSLVSAAVNGTPIYITNYKYIDSPVIYNATGGIVPATNYSLTNNFVYNGQETIKIVPNASAIQNVTGYVWKISGTAQPLGYISDGGGRSIANLIVLLMALAMVAVAVGYAIKSYQE